MGHFVECLSDVVKVSSVKTSDGNSSISSHVDCVFLSERGDLFLVQASVREHTNLARGVAPVVLVAEGLQL